MGLRGTENLTEGPFFNESKVNLEFTDLTFSTSKCPHHYQIEIKQNREINWIAEREHFTKL